MEEIKEIANNIGDLNFQAYLAYKPIIEDMLNRIIPEKQFEYIMDRFISFCGFEENYQLFEQVCEQYQEIYPEVVKFQKQQYKEMFEE